MMQDPLPTSAAILSEFVAKPIPNVNVSSVPKNLNYKLLHRKSVIFGTKFRLSYL